MLCPHHWSGWRRRLRSNAPEAQKGNRKPRALGAAREARTAPRLPSYPRGCGHGSRMRPGGRAGTWALVSIPAPLRGRGAPSAPGELHIAARRSWLQPCFTPWLCSSASSPSSSQRHEAAQGGARRSVEPRCWSEVQNSSGWGPNPFPSGLQPPAQGSQLLIQNPAFAFPALPPTAQTAQRNLCSSLCVWGRALGG